MVTLEKLDMGVYIAFTRHVTYASLIKHIGSGGWIMTNKIKSFFIKCKKRTWPILSDLDSPTLGNKGFILWSKQNLFFQEKAGNLKQARLAHFASSGSQSEHRVHIISPASGANNVIQLVKYLLKDTLT